MCVCWLLSRVQPFVIPWTVTNQAPLSMGFPRQEHWSGLPFPSPGDPPDPGIKSGLLNCRQILYQLSLQGNPQYPRIGIHSSKIGIHYSKC